MTMPGFNHRGKLIKPGAVADTWMVEIAALAAGRASGPIPSVTPGLQVGDTVLLSQIGTTRGDLVIVGRIPGELPDYTTIPGLAAALAAKAGQSDLTALTTRVGTDETAIAANASAITALTGRLTTDEGVISAHGTRLTADEAAITALQTRATADEALIAGNTTSINLLAADRRASQGIDYDLLGDLTSTCQRALATSSITLINGVIFYFRMRIRERWTLATIKTCIATAGTLGTGTLSMAVWAGHPASALPYIQTFNVTNVAANRQDFAVTTPPGLVSGDDIVVGFLAKGMTTPPALSASPVANLTLVNQDTATLTSVKSNTGQTTMGTSALDFTGTYNWLQQIAWLATAGVPW